MMSLQRELEAYDAERPLLPYQRELAARTVAGHQARLSELEAVADEFRLLDASQQANTARLRALQVGLVTAGSAGSASQALLALARANNDLAARRVSIVRMLDDAEGWLNDARAALADLGDHFERARDRVTAVGQTGAVGLMLQRHRTSLPAASRGIGTWAGVVQRQSRLTQEEMFDLDEQRVALADLRGCWLAGSKRCPTHRASHGPWGWGPPPSRSRSCRSSSCVSQRGRRLLAAHFLWPARAVALLRRHLYWVAAAALPLVLPLSVTSDLGIRCVDRPSLLAVRCAKADDPNDRIGRSVRHPVVVLTGRVGGGTPP